MSQDEICVLCGTTMAAGSGHTVAEGSACGSCAAARAAEPKKIVPIARLAMFAALVPICLSYATTTVTTDQSARHTTTTRVLIFSSSESSGFESRINGVAPGPATVKYSDPIAVAGGGAAVLLGVLGLIAARKAQHRRSLLISGGAALYGAYAMVHGLGLG